MPMNWPEAEVKQEKRADCRWSGLAALSGRSQRSGSLARAGWPHGAANRQWRIVADDSNDENCCERAKSTRESCMKERADDAFVSKPIQMLTGRCVQSQSRRAITGRAGRPQMAQYLALEEVSELRQQPVTTAE